MGVLSALPSPAHGLHRPTEVEEGAWEAQGLVLSRRSASLGPCLCRGKGQGEAPLSLSVPGLLQTVGAPRLSVRNWHSRPSHSRRDSWSQAIAAIQMEFEKPNFFFQNLRNHQSSFRCTKVTEELVILEKMDFAASAGPSWRTGLSGCGDSLDSAVSPHTARALEGPERDTAHCHCHRSSTAALGRPRPESYLCSLSPRRLCR